MSDLGSLYFSLGLDSDKFDKAIEAARKKVSDLGANVDIGFKVDVEDVGRQVQDQLKKLQGGSFNLKAKADDSEIQELKQSLSEASKELESLTNAKVKDNGAIDRVTKKVEHFTKLLREAEGTGQSKPIGLKVELEQNSVTVVRDQLEKLGHPVDVKITLVYDIEKFRAVETTLKNYAQNLTSVGNIKLGIDDSFLRTGMSATTEKGLKGWLGKVSDYLLGDDTGDAAKSVQQIQKILDSHPFKIKVTFDQQALISTMNKSLKGLPVKVDVDVAELQKKLKALKIPLAFNISQAINEAKAELKKKSFDAKLNLVIDRAKISKAIKEAFAKKGLEYQASPADVRNARILEIQQRMERSQKKFDGHVKKSTQSTNKLGTSMRYASDWASQLANQFNNFISLYSIERFIRNLYTIGGEFQKQQIALRNMIGDADKGNAIFERMKTLAVKSPFTFSELSSYTKQMAAYGIEYENLYDTTKRLADISAGVGVDMGRLILAFGQVRSAAVLRGQELRQFTEAGIPLVAELAKKFTELEGQAVSTGEVFDKISKREVSFDMVKDVLYDMTDPGGRFFEMQEELAESLAGKWSNLKDAWDVMIADIANGTNGPLNWLADTLTKLLKNSEAWVPAITGVVLALGAMRIAINGINLAMATSPLGLVGRALLILAPIIGGVVGHIIGLATESESATEIISKMRSELEGFKASSLENEQKAGRYLDTLKEQARTEDEKYELLKRQKKTFEELVKLYPKLMDGMTLEKMTLEEIERIRKRIKSQTEADIAYQHDKNVRDTYNRYLEAKQNEKNTRDSFRLKVEGNWIQQLTAATQEDVDNAEDATKAFYEAYEEAKRAKEKWIQETFYKKPEVRDQWMLTADALVEQYSSAHLRKPSEESIYSYFDYLEGIFKDAKSKYDRAASNELKKPQKAIMDAVNAVNMGIGGKSFYDKKKKSGKTAAEKAAERDAKAYAEALKNEISKISSQWNLFKDLMEASGNKKLSMNIAFGGQISFESQLEQLRSRIMEEAKKFKVGIGLYDLLGMGENQLLDAGVEEKAAKALGSLIKAYNDENKKLKDESVRNFIEILNSSMDFAQQIADIERELQKDLADLRSNAKGMSAEELKRRENELIRKAEEDKAKVQFEEFKKSSDWVKVFDDLDRYTTPVLDSMLDKMEDFVHKVEDSPEALKELLDAIGKMRDKLAERDPFGSFARSLEKLRNINAARWLLAGNQSYTFKQDLYGYKKGQTVTSESLDQDQQGAVNDFSKAIEGTSKAFENLQNVLSPVIDLFDDGSNVVGKFLEGIGNALGAASNMSSSLEGLMGLSVGKDKNLGEALGLKNAGMWGAIAGAGLSIAGSIMSAFGADYSDYEKAKEEYGRLVDTWDILIDKKQKYIDIDFADEARKAGEETLNLLNKEIEAYRTLGKERLNAGASIGSHSIGVRQRKAMSDEGWDELKKAAESIGFDYSSVADGRMTGLFELTAEQLSLLQEKAPVFWAKLDEDVQEYLQKIIDSNEALLETKDLIDQTMTGVEFDSFYDNYTSLLQDLDSDNKDFADNLEEYIKNAVIANLISGKYKDEIQKLYDSWVSKSDSDKDGVFDLTPEESDVLKKAQEDLTAQLLKERDALKEAFGWTESSIKEGLTASVKGVTENTADLLASYVNSMRADLSVNRSLIEKLVGDDVPKISYIAEAQLRELSQIQANTAKNVALVGEIRDLVNRVVDKGSNKLKV